ncbi:MAG: hypothetical protein IPK85_23150 [Gemmatimonadetes bacterium]|nr:hypothetical protein [Gemmatimonadota bacterium]
MRRAVLLLAFLLVDPVAAQSWRVNPGTKLRVVTPTGRVSGELGRAGADSLVILTSRGAAVVLRQADLLKVEMWGGRSRLAGAGAGAFWGAGLGGMLGAIAGSASCTPPNCSGASAEELGMFGAFTSIWLGALIGAAVGRDVWVPMALQLGPASGPAGRSAASLQWSVRF